MNKFFNYIIYFILLIIYGCIENNNPYSNYFNYSSIAIGEVRDLFISGSTLFVGTENEGTYVEKPGQTGYMRRNIVNGNTTLRVDMLTISDPV